jgi:predicted nucleic acid-binding protein
MTCGGLSGIVDLWKKGKIVPIVSRETFGEFKAVKYVVSGDNDVCDLGRYKSMKIMEPSEFLKMFS